MQTLIEHTAADPTARAAMESAQFWILAVIGCAGFTLDALRYRGRYTIAPMIRAALALASIGAAAARFCGRHATESK